MIAPAALRLGLIGAGRWGTRIAQTIGAMDGVCLHRLASRNADSWALVRPECIIHADWQALIAAGDLDGLMIASPPETHGSIALAAIEFGLPVFIEKPMTVDVAAARSIQDQAERRKVPVLVDHTHLFHASYRLLKETVPRLRGIRTIRSFGGNHGPFRRFDPLWDWGAHELSLILDLAGTDGAIVAASTLRREDRPEGLGAVYAFEMEFKSGIRAWSQFGNLMDRKTRLVEVECAEGALIMDAIGPHPLTVLRGKTKSVMPAERSQPLREALTAFVEGVAGRPGAAFGTALGVNVVGLLAALERKLRGSAPAVEIEHAARQMPHEDTVR